MPNYEFQCKSCGQRFESRQSVEEHMRAPAPCPECGSKETESVFSAFFPKTSRKS